MVLNAYERVLANWQGANPRFRIEFCSLVNLGLLERIKATGTISAPFCTYAHCHGEKWHEIAVLRTIPGGRMIYEAS